MIYHLYTSSYLINDIDYADRLISSGMQTFCEHGWGQ
jgi:hypothetical protein